MSVPDSTSTLTDAIPGAAIERTVFTAASPRTSSSILTTMASSTSSGVAPGNGTEISNWLKGTSGHPSCSRPVSDTRPTARMANINRLAATPLPAM